MIAAMNPQVRLSRGGGIVGAVEHQVLVIVAGIHHPCRDQLFFVADALGAVGLKFSARQRRQQNRREQCDDGYDNEQLDESETKPPLHVIAHVEIEVGETLALQMPRRKS